jgi:3-oxoacyl-[acyl-carrier-protein] synthase-3
MYHSKIGIRFYVPSNVVTNDDLSKNYYTNDEWIQERTGIQERRHIIRGEDTTTTMGSKAANSAFWLAKEDIDFVVLRP